MNKETQISAQKLLTHEHKKLAGLFKEYESASDDSAKNDVVQNLAMELHIHMMLEEQVFFPALEREGKGKRILEEQAKEADAMKALIDQVQRLLPDQDKKEYDSTIHELKKCLDNHIKQTEGKILPKAEECGLDMDKLGCELVKAKEQLKGGGSYSQEKAETEADSSQKNFNPEASS